LITVLVFQANLSLGVAEVDPSQELPSDSSFADWEQLMRGIQYCRHGTGQPVSASFLSPLPQAWACKMVKG
jgi:hypothetical protein